MSVAMTYVVACNNDGCQERFTADPYTKLATKATDVRKHAASAGWTRQFVPPPKGGPGWTLDFCPRCSAGEKHVRFARVSIEAPTYPKEVAK